jgi:hypothetical protein
VAATWVLAAARAKARERRAGLLTFRPNECVVNFVY